MCAVVVDGGSVGGCCVEGTVFDTPDGLRRVALIAAGDLVLTHDKWPMPVRWAGRQTIGGMDAFAPIEIAAGTFGATRPIRVSPQHRVLVTGWQAELFFGAEEVLVPAKALIDGRGVRRRPMKRVTYVHLLLDGHHVLRSADLWSESYDPTAWDSGIWHAGLAAELRALFPELARETGPTARVVVPVQAGRVLRAA